VAILSFTPILKTGTTTLILPQNPKSLFPPKPPQCLPPPKELSSTSDQLQHRKHHYGILALFYFLLLFKYADLFQQDIAYQPAAKAYAFSKDNPVPTKPKKKD